MSRTIIRSLFLSTVATTTLALAGCEPAEPTEGGSPAAEPSGYESDEAEPNHPSADTILPDPD